MATAPWTMAPAYADTTDGTITVLADLDANGDGAFTDGVDAPQSGITITVTDVSGHSRDGVTDEDGKFELKASDELTGGRYFVVANIPDSLGLVPVPAGEGYSPLNTTVDVTAGDQTIRFGVATTPATPTPTESEASDPTTDPEPDTGPTALETAAAAPPPAVDPSEPSFAVSGFVWQDLDRQGTQDDSDLPAEPTSVQLLDADGHVAASTVTRYGRYRFDGLPPGVYSVRFSGIKEGFRFAPTGVGSAGRDSDPDNTGVTPPFTLDVGAPNVHLVSGTNADYLNSTIDAGLSPLRYAVGAQVWQDASGDGIQQAGEPASQARVALLAAGTNTELATTTTDPAGRFLFDDLPNGRYRLRFSELGAHRQLTSAHVGSNPAVDSDPDPRSGMTAVFSLGQSSTELVPARDFGPVDADFVDATLNAGVVGSYTIKNRVWRDVNGDGLFSPGESGIGGVRVQVLNVAGAVVATTTTDRDGWYEFSLLPAGQYQLKFKRPAGLHFTATGAGGDPLADSDVYLDGLTAPITVGEDHPEETAVSAGLTASAAVAARTAPTTAPNASASVAGQPTLSGTGGLPAAVPVGGAILLLAGAALVWVARRRRSRR